MLTVVACGVAFIAMASVFVPFDSYGERDSIDTPDPAVVPPHEQHGSVDPHEGLAQIGTLEHSCYFVRVYATEREPRYSVYDRTDGRELGVLLSEEQVEEWFPELPLRGIDFEAPKQYMMVPTDRFNGR